MMRRRFFVEKFEGQRAELRGEAAGHLGRVLRAEPGQLYELTDGEQVWLARVDKNSRGSKNGAAIEFVLVEQIPAVESALRVKLLLSIVKFDRMEWCLEKATELGATEIIPLAAARSEKTLILAAAKRASRWQKILIESAQQSRRLRPPVLAEIAKVDDAFGSANESVKVLLSEHAGANPLREVVQGVSAKEICFAIGPEGGWTDAELASAAKCEFREASLGREILRTETAVIASLAIFRYALDSSRNERQH
ncbi:MAG TPA: RsmE family RNA methyltransferase [Candidatus Acidoferrales bacterium]|nr:RsmE family RNA methyltransferase [Candidatus Acidoferrales bacterium]